jgi:hypothetical protein
VRNGPESRLHSGLPHTTGVLKPHLRDLYKMLHTRTVHIARLLHVCRGCAPQQLYRLRMRRRIHSGKVQFLNRHRRAFKSESFRSSCQRYPTLARFDLGYSPRGGPSSRTRSTTASADDSSSHRFCSMYEWFLSYQKSLAPQEIPAGRADPRS